MQTVYSKFDPSELGLRDELAIDRTTLANERTLLAYLRCGIALLIAGVTITHFAEEGWFLAVGMACLPSGLIALIAGVAKYSRMRRRISLLRSAPLRASTARATWSPPAGAGRQPASRPGRAAEDLLSQAVRAQPFPPSIEGGTVLAESEEQ